MKELRICLTRIDEFIPKLDSEDAGSNSKSPTASGNRDRNYLLHQCKMCKKKFRTKSGLIEHTHNHTRDNYVHECKTCHKTFNRISRLRQHERVHDANRARKFQCEECSKRFQEKYLLKAHLVTHKESKDFKCPICSKMFLSKVRVQFHLSTHTKEKPFVCSKCDYMCSNMSNLKDHERRAHNFACSKCNLPFVKASDLNKHNKLEHGEELCKFCDSVFPAVDMEEHQLRHVPPMPYSCKVCHKTFRAKNTLEQHRNKHTTKFCCDICSKCFANPGRLARHKLIHSDKNNFPCEICGKSFVAPDNLRIHMNKWHTEPPIFTCSCKQRFKVEIAANDHARASFKKGEEHVIVTTYIPAKPFKCDFCGFGFSAKSDLDRHILTHTKVKEYVCQLCEKPFACSKGLFAHVATHTKEKLLQCGVPNCGQRFSSWNSLNSHRNTHYTTASRKLIPCTICNNGKLYLETSLKVHMRNHRSSRSCSYACTEKDCKKSFKQKKDLSRHVRFVHLGEKNHFCGLCEKTFDTKTHLTRHVNSHTGERIKIHACEHCDKRFPEKNQLNIHMRRIHEKKDKKHLCPFCAKGFFTRSELGRHIVRHTGEKPEKCNFCSLVSNSKSNMETHMRKKHSIQVNN